MEADRVPRHARLFVCAVVGIMLASAAFLWEPWPFTSFRLFSNVRVDQQSAWSATVINAEGEESPYSLGAAERGFRGFPFVMAEFAAAGDARQAELCRTWVEAAPALIGERAEEVRIYLRTWALSDRIGDRARPGSTELKYVCSEAGVRDA